MPIVKDLTGLWLTDEPRGDRLTNRCLKADIGDRGFSFEGWRDKASFALDYTGDEAFKMYHIPRSDLSGDPGLFQSEIILPVRPSSNEFIYEIRTKGLRFCRQDELTQEDIAQGAYRPPDVVGSYAVFLDKAIHNITIYDGELINYGSGKVCHIYRPVAFDNSGKTVYCDLSIDSKAGLLKVTVPEKFLAEADYPVIVDPTIGYTTKGASNQTMNQGAQRGTSIPSGDVSSGGDLDTAHASITYNSASTGNFDLGIYDDDSGPDSLVASTGSFGHCTSFADLWVQNTNCFTQLNGSGVALSGSITASTKYYASMMTGQSSVSIAYDTDGSYDGYRDFTDRWPGFPSTSTLSSDSTNKRYSIYFSYTESAGAESVTKTGTGHVIAEETDTITGTGHVIAEESDTINGLGHVVSEETDSITGLGHVIAEETDAITGLGHVIAEESANITGLGHVGAVESDTITGLGHVIAEESAQITGLGHIITTETDTITGLGHVGVVESDSIIGLGHVIAVETDTITGIGHVTGAVGVEAAQITGLGHVLAEESVEITGLGHVITTESDSIGGLGHVIAVETDTIAGLGHVIAEETTGITGLGHIIAEESANITGLGYVVIEESDTIAGLGHVITEETATITGLGHITGGANIKKSILETMETQLNNLSYSTPVSNIKKQILEDLESAVGSYLS